jgi:hypothetical protein
MLLGAPLPDAEQNPATVLHLDCSVAVIEGFLGLQYAHPVCLPHRTLQGTTPLGQVTPALHDTR